TSLRQREDAAGRWAMVGDDVQRQEGPCGQSDRSLRVGRARQARAERRWLARHLHSEHESGRRQGSELAAGPERPVQSDAARVLAEARFAARALDAAAAEAIGSDSSFGSLKVESD